jgi:hypothetical protein
MSNKLGFFATVAAIALMGLSTAACLTGTAATTNASIHLTEGTGLRDLEQTVDTVTLAADAAVRLGALPAPVVATIHADVPRVKQALVVLRQAYHVNDTDSVVADTANVLALISSLQTAYGAKPAP